MGSLNILVQVPVRKHGHLVHDTLEEAVLIQVMQFKDGFNRGKALIQRKADGSFDELDVGCLRALTKAERPTSLGG